MVFFFITASGHGIERHVWVALSSKVKAFFFLCLLEVGFDACFLVSSFVIISSVVFCCFRISLPTRVRFPRLTPYLPCLRAALSLQGWRML